MKTFSFLHILILNMHDLIEMKGKEERSVFLNILNFTFLLLVFRILDRSWLTILVGSWKHLCFIRNCRKCSAYHNGKISSILSPFLMECFTKICFICLTENKLLRYRRLSEDLWSLQRRLIWVRQDQHLGYVRNTNASSSCLKQAE